MEMRLLTNEFERRIFVERLARARDQQLAHFADVCRGTIDNRARLAASDLYALFEHPGESATRMLAGVAIHNLEMFPRTCAGPDLSYLPDRSVFECSDHWSLARGAGMRMWHGAAIQLARHEPRAILVYLAAGSSDHMGFYQAMGFVPFGEPAQFLYLETSEGFPWVQPMILQGHAMDRLGITVSKLPFETSDNYFTVRFGASLRLRPGVDRSVLPSNHVTPLYGADASRGDTGVGAQI
ncbi:MAG TPA: hypothetical protein VJX23_14080 [Candidatus Binataceae bacterium]|nr:hypothetical protein [Candidatus Binataceae bacterium]